MRTRRLFVVVLSLAVFTLAFADSKEDLLPKTNAPFKRGYYAAGVQSTNVPFRVRERITLFGTQNIEGTFLLERKSGELWREEVEIGGQRRVEIIRDGFRFVERSTPHETYLMSMTKPLLRFRYPWPDNGADKIHRRKLNGRDTECAVYKYAEYCFDTETGVLVTSVAGERRWEYSDHAQLGDALRPRKLRFFKNGQLAALVQVDETTRADDLEEARFQPSPAAVKYPHCERQQPAKGVRTPMPPYPPRARSNYMQGTVVIFAIVGADGRMQDPEVVESAGDEFDSAALKSFKQWEWKPAICFGEPVESEVTVPISFTLGR